MSRIKWRPRQGLADETSDTLPHREVVTFDISGVNRRATAIGVDNHRNVIRCAKHNVPSYFHHPPALASLVDLSIAQLWGHQTSRLLARTTRAPWSREWLRDTVIAYQSRDVGRQFVTGKEGGLTIGTRFELPDKGLGCCFTALLAQITEESRDFYTIPGRGIAALIQGLTRILTSKPACEAWSKGLSGAQSLSLALPYSCWCALDNPTVPRPLV